MGNVLELLSFARTSRSRRLSERRYARIGFSLKILLKRSEEWRIGCILHSIFRMLGRAGLYVVMKGILSGFSDAEMCSSNDSFLVMSLVLFICSLTNFFL